MVVNFKTRGISRGACKLIRTPTLIKKKLLKTRRISDNNKFIEKPPLKTIVIRLIRNKRIIKRINMPAND